MCIIINNRITIITRIIIRNITELFSGLKNFFLIKKLIFLFIKQLFNTIRHINYLKKILMKFKKYK